MYSRKRVGRRRVPRGFPALTGHSFENFQFKTTQSPLLLRKEERSPNI